MAKANPSSTALKVVTKPDADRAKLESIEFRLSEIASIACSIMQDACDLTDGNLECRPHALREMARRVGTLAESVGADLGVEPRVCDFQTWEPQIIAERGVA